MNERMKRVFSSILAVALIGLTVACGARDAGIDDVAALRGKGVGAGEIYIDEPAIALAGSYATPEEVSAAVTAAFNLVNTHRANAGLSALTWSDGLAQAAAVRANEITTSFSHTRPNGSDWWTVNSALQYGENLAKLYNSADTVTAAWMNSPTHKANILYGGFKTIGIAIYQGPNGWYWAQEFGY